MQEGEIINIKQQRVEFFEEYGFVPEIDDLDIEQEEDSEMWEVINKKHKTRGKLFNLRYKDDRESLYP